MGNGMGGAQRTFKHTDVNYFSILKWFSTTGYTSLSKSFIIHRTNPNSPGIFIFQIHVSHFLRFYDSCFIEWMCPPSHHNLSLPPPLPCSLISPLTDSDEIIGCTRGEGRRRRYHTQHLQCRLLILVIAPSEFPQSPFFSHNDTVSLHRPFSQTNTFVQNHKFTW